MAKGNKNLTTAKEDEVLVNMKDLIKYLNLALENLKSEEEKILNDLAKWNSEITMKELEDGLYLILENVERWFASYVKTKDILQINLKEYDTISKESAYILGECALIDELYFEIIDFLIGGIGATMCEEIKNGGIALE